MTGDDEEQQQREAQLQDEAKNGAQNIFPHYQDVLIDMA
jgi:hypothetical protein